MVQSDSGVYMHNDAKTMDLVEKWRSDAGLSKRELCQLSGIKERSYYKYLNGSEPSFKTVRNIIKGLGFHFLVIKEII